MCSSVPGHLIEAAREALAHQGVGPGRRVVLEVDPDPVGVAWILAADATGAWVSPLNPGWTLPERRRILDRFQPHLYVTRTEEGGADSPEGTLRLSARRILPCQGDAPGSRVVEGGGGTVGRGRGRELEGPDSSPFDVLEGGWLLWTSGSTGTPRGVVLDRAAFRASARASALRLGLDRADCWIASLSPAHVGGLALLLRARDIGCSLVAPGPFDPEVFSSFLDDERVTHASLVPVQLERVLEVRGDRPFQDGLRTVLLGGAAASPELLARAVEARIPVASTWGMTEAASQVATAPPPLVSEKAGTVGPPLDGLKVRRDPESGELAVRGSTMARGEFQGTGLAPTPLVDPEGWYWTGDVGRVDDDGHLWITGRISERIVSGGVTVEPGEVESVLTADRRVREAAVVGLPDPEWGERPVALVVPEGPASPTLPDELSRDLRGLLSPAKRPREVRVARELPRTSTGKVDRAAVRELLHRGKGGSTPP